MLISDLYHKDPITAPPDITVAEAIESFISNHINGLIIIGDSKKVLGVLSLQDIAAATVPRQFRKNISMASAMYRKGFFSDQCRSILDKKVTEVMRKNFVSVALDENILAITADFLKNDLYIVPVIDKNKLVGVVTRSEIKHALAYGMGLSSKYWKRMKGQ